MAIVIRNNILRGTSFVVFLSVTYFSNICHAQYWVGPVANGLGGAGRAAVDQGEQAVLNPATIVHSDPFTSALFYEDGYTAKNEHDRSMGICLSDNSENLFMPGAYIFLNRRRTFEKFESRDEEYHQLSAGQFVAKHFAMGATVSYLESKTESGGHYTQFDGHVGLHYNPNPDLGLGLVFYNLAPKSEKIPLEVRNLDNIVLAAHYIFMPMFRVRADIGQQQSQNPDKKTHYNMGFESHISQLMMTRVGFERDDVNDRHFYTLGLGFDGPRLKIDYFYKKNTDYADGAMHGVDMRLPFW
jgi:hypothetical protein